MQHEVPLDRVPPQNLEAEQSTLGSMMIDRVALNKGLELLDSEAFYRPAHQTIFEALEDLSQRDEPADLITLQEVLRKRGKLEDIGGTEYLMRVVESVPTAANVEHYAKIVVEKHLLRMLAAIGDATRAAAYNDADAEAQIATLSDKIIQLNTRRGSNIRVMKDVANSSLNMLDDIDKGRAIPTAPFGIKSLDNLLNGGSGIHQLTIIGASTSHGKSALAHMAALATAKRDIPVLIHSLEMTGEEINIRFDSMMASIDASSFGKGLVNWDKLMPAHGEIAGFPIEINDTAGMLHEMEAITRNWVMKHKMPFGLVIVDHLQLVDIKGKIENETVKSNSIVTRMTEWIRTMPITVIALTQVRKQPSITRKGANSKPEVEDGFPYPAGDDLYGGNATSTHAHKILMVYNPPTAMCDGDGKRLVGTLVLKHRGGRTGERKLWFWPRYTRFDDYAGDITNEPPPRSASYDENELPYYAR